MGKIRKGWKVVLLISLLVCVSFIRLMMEVIEVFLMICIRKFMVGGSEICIVCGRIM